MTRPRAARYAAALETIQGLPTALLRVRQRDGITQQAVADATDVLRVYVSHVERGRLTDVPVVALLRLLSWLDQVDGPRTVPAS